MQLTTEIRSETAADRQGIREVVTAAFNGSNEADLVDALRDDGALAVSLTADQAGALLLFGAQIQDPRLDAKQDKTDRRQ